MNRRSFLQAAVAAAASGCATSEDGPPRIIDSHTHFYDPTRTEGVPWPDAQDPVLYRPILPPEFTALTKPLGVVGTVVIEASPWPQDNDWLLALAEKNPVILGVVGHLVPGTPKFRTQIDRLARNRRFRGIRIGSEPLRAAQSPGAEREDLKHLARRNLSLDVLIPPTQLSDAANLGLTIPDLQIIVDHCSNVPVGTPPPNEWVAGLVACHYAPNVSMKVSGLVEGTGRREGAAPSDPAVYQSVLDAIWHPFGEDRVLFGSNWPVSLHFASYETVLRIVQEYFASKGPRASAKYFHRNASRVYRLS